MEVILLEKVEKLGKIGEVVAVKNGFARNFLLPRNKALRATADNLKYIEAEKAKYEAKYQEQVAEAQKQLKSFDKATVNIIRQASEDGRLYGSVTAKEIAHELTEVAKGVKIAGNMVALKNNIREIGLFDVQVVLHPDVKTTITVNVARSEEEADAALIPAEIVEEEKPTEANVNVASTSAEASESKKDKKAASKNAESAKTEESVAE